MTLAIALSNAVICADLTCNTIWNARLSRTCPTCGFALAAHVSKWINRPVQEAHHDAAPRGPGMRINLRGPRAGVRAARERG